MRLFELFLRSFDRIHHGTRPPRSVAAGYGELHRQANHDAANAPALGRSATA
jgi:hypothetical protein